MIVDGNIIEIETESIKLDALLKYAGLVDTGGVAKMQIELGEVNVNGRLCTQRGKKIKSGDRISFKGKDFHVQQR